MELEPKDVETEKYAVSCIAAEFLKINFEINGLKEPHPQNYESRNSSRD